MTHCFPDAFIVILEIIGLVFGRLKKCLVITRLSKFYKLDNFLVKFEGNQD